MRKTHQYFIVLFAMALAGSGCNSGEVQGYFAPVPGDASQTGVNVNDPTPVLTLNGGGNGGSTDNPVVNPSPTCSPSDPIGPTDPSAPSDPSDPGKQGNNPGNSGQGSDLVECEIGGLKVSMGLSSGHSNSSSTRVCMSSNACLNLVNAYAAEHGCTLAAGAPSSSNGEQCTAIFPGSAGTCKNAEAYSDEDVTDLLNNMAAQ